MPATTERQQPSQLRLRRSFRAPPEKVWRAWTEAQALNQWFAPGADAVVSAEIDLRVGGAFRIASRKNGQATEAFGTYLEVQPHHRLVFSWAWRGTPERVSRVSIALAPTADGTEMEFVHDRFFDAQARINHERGWAPALDKLVAHVESASSQGDPP
jgi:uncharacterized protein YndB with AHSA1/START domain